MSRDSSAKCSHLNDERWNVLWTTRPDGTAILPWSRGKTLAAWDVTIPDTFADAHVIYSARKTGAAAKHAAFNKFSNYSRLTMQHPHIILFTQWSSKRREPGTGKPLNWTISVTGDDRLTCYLFQQNWTASCAVCSTTNSFQTRSLAANSLQSVFFILTLISRPHRN